VNPGRAVFLVEVGSAWLNRLAGFQPLSDPPGFAGSAGEFSGLLIRLRRECLAGDFASDLIIDGLVIELFGQVQRGLRGSRTPPGWVRTIRDLLHDRFRDPLTLRQLAVEVGVHPVHLCREFRRHTGLTIGAYTRRLRIDYACSELAGTERPLTEIALDSGFSSQAHFSSTFRGVAGLSPSMFRARCRAR